MIDGNLPACQLCEGLGIEYYGSSIDFQATPGTTSAAPVLPAGNNQM